MRHHHGDRLRPRVSGTTALHPYGGSHRRPPHLEDYGLRPVTNLRKIRRPPGRARLGRCMRFQCSRAYVDTSRNGRRRYVTARCGNTEAVMRHRSRQPCPKP
ncbi:CGNR zinc finger domain-containing protein [Streptomyces sp. AC555_RSS877]|uniref:CGNR zinc finger domain-containing protein n=1 Tax=Streptomyces sp. AC555_RSS877 TaxID=2823688 RepID=UPI0026662479|nr:CGNR zinc finger domain-containing protein [Streptomyces sp. AC555_RSS877]